jgi:hypothetical protein
MKRFGLFLLLISFVAVFYLHGNAYSFGHVVSLAQGYKLLSHGKGEIDIEDVGAMAMAVGNEFSRYTDHVFMAALGILCGGLCIAFAKDKSPPKN